MFCPSCGAATEGKFCEKCGAAVSPGAAYAGAVPPVVSAPGLPMNIVAVLCYIVPVICPIIFLVVDPYKRDKTVRFAALQSLFLSIALFIVNEVIAIALGTSYDVAYNMCRLLHLAEIILICYLAFKAFQNEKVVLPGIGPLAQKQA